MGQQTAIQYELEMLEAELEAARLLVYKSAWMMDNKMPNSKEASMGKAESGQDWQQDIVKNVLKFARCRASQKITCWKNSLEIQRF